MQPTLLFQLGLPWDKSVVCLNTGGAFGPSKNWPTEHFAALARHLAVEAGVPALVLCGPAERAAAREIVAGLTIQTWLAWPMRVSRWESG